MRDKANKSLLKVPRGVAKRNVLDKEKDTWFVVAELAKGKTYKEIADALNKKNPNYNLSASTLKHDVRKILVEWKRENLSNIEAYIAENLAKLERMEEEALMNFERSKMPRPFEYGALVKHGYSIEEIDEMYKRRGGAAGNPQYFETLLHIMDKRLSLLGISKGADNPQQSIVNYNFGNTSLDDLANIADSLQDGKLKELTIDNQNG